MDILLVMEYGSSVMKKILLVFSLVLVSILSTGCSVNYTLKYEDDTFTEHVQITGESEDDAHPTYADILEDGLYADIDGVEKFELDASSTRYDVSLTHELSDVKLDRLQAVFECFTLNTYKELEGSYYLALYGDFTCPYLTNSTFTLETDARVITNNAHEVDGNKYIWYLDEDKLGEDGIIFQVMNTEVASTSIKSDSFLPIWVKLLLGLMIIGVGVGLVFFLKKLEHKE